MIVMVFADHQFESLEQFPDPAEAKAYARGVVAGAHLYAGDGCHAYVLPDEDVDMHSCEEDGEIGKGIAELEKRFGHNVTFRSG